MIPSKKTADGLLDKGVDLFNKSEWDGASECWDKAKKIYEELGYKQGISNTLNNLGLVYQNKGEWERAIEYYEKSLKISEELGDNQEISNALIGLGNVYRNRGELEHAIEFYEKSLKISEELGYKQGISNALIGLGNVYQNRGEWEHAIEFYEKSLKISEELGDKQGISNTLCNLGNVYQNRGEWERAIEFYEKSLKISEELDDKQGISGTLNNLGIVYKNKGEWEHAIEYYEKSLKISEELGDKQGISNTLCNLGNVYQNKGEWEHAIEFYEKSLKIFEELGDEQGISNALNNIGELQLKNGNWDEARKNLERSLSIAEKLAPIATVEALMNIGELFRLEDQYNDAFRKLEDALQIVSRVGSKPQEILILEKLGDTHVDKYATDRENESLSFAERFYSQAFEIAKSLNMPLQEATATRGIGVAQAKKGDFEDAKKSFMNSIETLRRLGAFFELQKTSLEYAKALYENNSLIEAEMAAKAVAFDTWHNDYKELLVKAYLLLGDIVMKQEKQYGYYLDALKTSEFNPKIYVRTCFIMIYRMKKMDDQLRPRFIQSLKEVNRNRDKYFDKFLDALSAKLEGKEYDISGLPGSLEQEFKDFSGCWDYCFKPS